jgi:hypothetical protein
MATLPTLAEFSDAQSAKTKENLTTEAQRTRRAKRRARSAERKTEKDSPQRHRVHREKNNHRAKSAKLAKEDLSFSGLGVLCDLCASIPPERNSSRQAWPEERRRERQARKEVVFYFFPFALCAKRRALVHAPLCVFARDPYLSPRDGKRNWFAGRKPVQN